MEDEQALVEETKPPHTTPAFENFKLDFSKYPLTYMKASDYKGPVVEGWPPERNRSMERYIRPNEDTFLMRPTLEAVKNCQMLIIGKSEKKIPIKSGQSWIFFYISVHTVPDFFEARSGIRSTYGRYIEDGLAGNTSLIFLIGKIKDSVSGSHRQLVEMKIKQEQDFFGDILQVSTILSLL